MSRSTVSVVSHRSQKTSSGIGIPTSSIMTPSYTASSYLQTSSIGKPQTRTTTTTTTNYTSSISSYAKPTTTVTTSSISNQRSNTSKPSVPNVVSTTKTTTSSVVVNQRSNQGSSNQASKPSSQVASKAASQAPTKKIEIKKEVTRSGDGSEIQEAFELFDSNDGKLNVREVRDAMLNIGYELHLVIFVKLLIIEFQKKKVWKILEMYLIYFLMTQILIQLVLNQLKELLMNWVKILKKLN